jgi:hypothetical protein
MTTPTGVEPRPAPAAEPGWFEELRDLYATADVRVLGAFRIFFAAVLLAELARRAQNLTLFYSNEGVLTNHFLLFSPQSTPQWSLLFACSTPGQAAAGFGLIGLAFAALLVGFQTRAAQWLSLAGLMSLNGRNQFFEDGGVVVLLVLATFTAFLPLGERFSVDAALRAARAERPTPRPAPARSVASLAVLALVVELAAIYAFNVLHKRGPTWASGEAVHWVLWQNRVVTPLGAWLRAREPAFLSPLCSYATFAFEGGIALLAVSPVRPAACRALALGLCVALHGAMALVLNLGPFPLSMISLLLVVQRGEAFDAVARAVGRRLRPAGARPLVVAYDAALPGPRRAAALLSALDPFGALAFVGRAGAPGAAGPPFAVRSGGPGGDAAGAGDGEGRAGDGAAAGDEGDGDRGDGAAAGDGGEGDGGEGDGGDGGAWRPDPAGAAALAALPAVRPAAPLLEPLLRSWLALPPVPSPPPAAAPPLGPLRRAARTAREAAAGAFLLAVVAQITVDNRAVPKPLRVAPPGPLASLVLYPRLLQGWRMFAPDVPTDDGIGVVDAVTADGRHIDPFTGAPPALDDALDGPVPHNVMVSDYLFAMQLEHNQRYQRDLRAYLEAWHERAGRPEADRITQYKVYWASHDSPRPGETRPTNYRRRLIFEGAPTPAPRGGR